MKKIFSFVAAALFCATLSAQQLNEGFEGEGFPPEGWTVNNVNSYSGWTKGVKEGNNCAVVSGTYGTDINGSYLITPQLKPAAGEKLTFSARVSEYASKGQLRVEVSLTGTEISSFEVLDTYYTSSNASTNKIWKTDWSTFTIDLSAYAGQRIFIAFHQYDDAEKIYLDNVTGVTIAGSATCDVPTNIVVSHVTDESATVSWEGEAAAYQYVLMPGGEAADWSLSELTEEKSVVLTNLYEDTYYDFFVRSYCSDEEQSLAPKTAIKTTCQLQSIPWLETFTRDATGAVAPECWSVASERPQVWVVADKTYNDEGEAQVIYGQAHLGVSGGGTNTPQVFALPAFDAQLNTLEVAFDYKTNMVSDSYGRLEVGYMTNPSKASSFISLQTLPQTLTYEHAIIPLNDLPADAQYVAFRFAGGTSDLGALSMDNFVMAEIGHSQEIDPSQEVVPDAAIYSLTYCEAGFTWYSYNAEAFAIGLFDAEAQALVGGIVATTGECDRFAYQDGVSFSEDDDYENHYYCSTKWILNADEEGVQRGDAWENDVINVGTAASPVLGLKPGKYQVQVYALVQEGSSYAKGDLLATIPFELVSKQISNLEVTVAEDKTTATFTWEQPTLSTGERIYVSVRSGETVAYDNFDDTKVKAVSPLTVEVIEGKSYEAIFQIIDKNYNPLGAEVTTNFTVGVNNYEPQNPTATVFGGDNVTFEWNVAQPADRYVITLYWEGEFYATLTVAGTTKTTTMPKDGTWSWTVQAFNQGTNGNYFPASNAVAGNDFVSKGADIPEDAIQLEIADFNAFYIDENSQYYQPGLNAWVLIFRTADEEGYAGYPISWFLVYTAKERALSGVYNIARGNIDLESCLIIPDANAGLNDYVLAEDAEVRLQFDGFDEEKMEQGYVLAYYTGSFRLVGNNGKTYVARFMEQFCYSGNFDQYNAGNASYEGMFDEDGDTPWGIEQVINESADTRKVLLDGQLLIIRDGKAFNAQGILVK